MQFYTKKTTNGEIHYSCPVGKKEHKEVSSIIKDGEVWYAYESSDVFNAARERIAADLWSFVPSFLSKMSGIDVKVFETLAVLSEDSQPAILALVAHTCGVDKFVRQALDTDGYGHFLSAYNGREVSVKTGSKTFYLYRAE